MLAKSPPLTVSSPRKSRSSPWVYASRDGRRTDALRKRPHNPNNPLSTGPEALFTAFFRILFVQYLQEIFSTKFALLRLIFHTPPVENSVETV